MSNDDSFNDGDEVFSLYSSKKVTDTFKAQLKKIAANNHISKTFLNTNKEDTSIGEDEKHKNHEIQIEKELEITISEPLVLDNDSITPVNLDYQSPLEDSIEVITEITPRSTRRSKRLRKKKEQSSCDLNESISFNSNITVNKRITRGKKNSKKIKQKKGKNIEEITIEDSPQLTEPEDDLNPEISVKVIWKSVNVKKFQMRKFQKLSYIFEQLSKEENIPENKVMLTFNNVRVSPNDTPDSLNLQVYNFLDGGVLSELSNLCETPNSKNTENGDFVTLKFQDVNKKIIKLDLNKNEKLKVGMIKCSEQLEIPLNKIKFYFDGELLEPLETPESLGVENEVVIDIKIC